jgi:hypothetical protein
MANDETTELSLALDALAAAGPVEVHEDGEWLAELANLQYEVRRSGRQPLVHLWSDSHNLTRRVLRVSGRASDRIVLEVQRFGCAKHGRLEFLHADAARPARRVTREQFRARFRRMLAEQFPDARVESLSSAADLEHSFSGNYSRGMLTERRQAWAVMGVSPSEETATIEAVVTFGLLWLDWLRQRADRRAVTGLRLFLPEGSARIPMHRLQALAPTAHVELYEFAETTWSARRIEPGDTGNVESWLTPRRDVEAALAAARGVVERIRALAPAAIETVISSGAREVALQFRGLEFARWCDGRTLFGFGPERCELTRETWPAIANLVADLVVRRDSLAEDTNDPLYRAAPERWLERLVLADPWALDAQLNPQHLYSQTPAFSAGDRGVMDILGVTRQGRLVVIELKASEDLHLPLQAVDYWLRVRSHHRQGDFPRYGHFAGIELDPRPPLLWLVAPGLQFHPATDALLRNLSPEIQITRIGLNETWRRGLRVVFRM